MQRLSAITQRLLLVKDKKQIQEEQIRYAKFVTVDELTQHIPWASESAELKTAIQSQINFPVSH